MAQNEFLAYLRQLPKAIRYTIWRKIHVDPKPVDPPLPDTPLLLRSQVGEFCPLCRGTGHECRFECSRCGHDEFGGYFKDVVPHGHPDFPVLIRFCWGCGHKFLSSADLEHFLPTDKACRACGGSGRFLLRP